jgi:hypothetical protein
MSVISVYAIRDMIAGLDLSNKVISASNNGTNTTILVGNVFNARAGLTVDVDGTGYAVVSADYSANSIILAGVIASPILFTVPNPFFFHGTFSKTNGELNELLSLDQKVPMAYLHETMREVYAPIASGLEVTASVKLFLLDKAPENGDTTANQYADIIWPLSNLATAIRKALNASYAFAEMGDITQINEVEWGIYTDSKGHMKRFFDAQLSGISMFFDLPILKKCC